MRLFLAIVLFGLVLASAPANADPVKVDGARHADFGRLVFVWPTPVGHKLQVRDDGVVIRFDRPIVASYKRALRTLRRYIDQAVPEADGRGVRLILKRKFDTYSYDSGRSIIVEMAETPETAQAVLPTTAEKPALKKKEKPLVAAKSPKNQLPTIAVRGGAHKDYTRIVFDWPTNVDYKFSQAGGVVTIRFARASNIDLRRLTRDRPRLMGDIIARPSANTTDVAFAVPPTSKVRHFRSGPKVVIDIRQPSGSDVAAKLPDNVLPNEAPKTPTETPPNAPQKKQVEAEKPKLIEATPKAPDQNVAGVGKPAKAQAAKPQSPVPLTALPHGAATPSVSGASPTAPVTPVETVNDPGLEDAAVSVSENKTDAGGMDLRFDWKAPVAAAVFRRVGKLWIVFDAKRRVNRDIILGAKPNPADKGKQPAQDAPPPPPNLSKFVFSVDQIVSTSGTVLRMSTSKDVNPVLSRDGFSWILTFRKQALEPKTPLEIAAQPASPIGARIFIATPEPGRPIGITDPDVGDNMVVVPLIPLSHGVARAFTYPEVKFPITGQGVLILASTDHVRVRSLRQGVELSSSDPLSISSVTAEEAAGSKLGAIGPVSRLLDLERWVLPRPGDFLNAKRQLQRDLINAKDAKAKQVARWNLANFYFANAYAAESLGILQNMVADIPEFESTPQLKLVRGANKYLMGHYADAAGDLSDSGLDDVDEGAFWRAAVIAKSGQMVAAAHELRRTGAISQPYPKPLRFPLGLLVAEAAVEIGDIENARKFLDALIAADPTNKEQAEIAYVEGKLAEVGGDEEGAISKWEEALDSDDRATQVKAAYARMDLLIKMQRMTPPEAIDILEGLRFLWRGDEFEFNLLRRLGLLYLDEKGYRRGLEALRQAATYYRDYESAAQVTQSMSDAFNFLYLKDGADQMAPVKAIALYDEFRELTPAGRKGDEMIRKLADRLVNVDLLDQAAALLNDQVRFRLKGLEKAQVGTNLALVHAIARENDSVLEVLDATRFANAPDALAERRRHLRAVALIGLKRGDEALALLKKDKSFNAELIRSEMYWREGDWANASQFLHRVVRAAGIRPNQVLNDEQAIRVLNLATAYTLSGNERALIRLRTDFGAAMERTQFNQAFRLVAAPLATGMIDPASVSSRVKTVTNFRSFLDQYKDKLKTTELSSLTNVGGKPNENNVPLVKG